MDRGHLNIVIPMNGSGQRFVDAGYTTFKPFLPVNGKTMIEAVVENVTPMGGEQRLHVITRRDFAAELMLRVPHARQRILDEPTEGAACTILTLAEEIDNEQPLLIVNSDQLVDWDNPQGIGWFLMAARNYDACILTLPADEPKYSYAKVHNGEVLSTAEKKVISPYGTVGLYWFRHGQDFVKAAKRMIEDNDRFNGEFYVCPAFNYLPRHKYIGFFNVAKERAHFLGAPKEYEAYLDQTELPRLHRFAAIAEERRKLAEWPI